MNPSLSLRVCVRVCVCVRVRVRPRTSRCGGSLQPMYLVDGLGPGQPGVAFNGNGTFLSAAAAALPADATIIAVFRDDGSTGGARACCSGVVFYGGSDRGVSTAPVSDLVDDDDGASQAGTPIVALLDSAGEASAGPGTRHGCSVCVWVCCVCVLFVWLRGGGGRLCVWWRYAGFLQLSLEACFTAGVCLGCLACGDGR